MVYTRYASCFKRYEGLHRYIHNGVAVSSTAIGLNLYALLVAGSSSYDVSLLRCRLFPIRSVTMLTVYMK